jgi:hypothetical protein
MNQRLAEKTAGDAAAATVSAVQAGTCGGGGYVVAPMDIETPTVSDTVSAPTVNS